VARIRICGFIWFSDDYNGGFEKLLLGAEEYNSKFKYNMMRF
jgi:hypothetical protein